ncbi:E-selectin-like [Tubulanus polymorphus]|uniref:E-selectin-like n=1 Tax=Tubulanus polymorphus TaxID=672921 RepID=UPI003DA3284E
MKLLTSILLLVGSTTAVIACSCGSGWKQVGQKCFKLSPSDQEAQYHCGPDFVAMPCRCVKGWRKKAGQNKCTHIVLREKDCIPYFANIENSEENKAVRRLIPKQHNTVWLGYKTTMKKGYTNWGTDEPNNGGGNQYEGCVEMVRTTGKWNDNKCSNRLPAICSKSCQ